MHPLSTAIHDGALRPHAEVHTVVDPMWIERLASAKFMARRVRLQRLYTLHD
jgi:hypothetical protein